MVDATHYSPCYLEEEMIHCAQQTPVRSVSILNTWPRVFILEVKFLSNKKDIHLANLTRKVIVPAGSLAEAVYLSTRRDPDAPRQFATVEAAMATAYKMFQTQEFWVMYVGATEG